MAQPMTGIDPTDLDVCLRVLSEASSLDADHPDSVALQRPSATCSRSSSVAAATRRATRSPRPIAPSSPATATGSPDRIDDETAGIPLTSNTVGATAGTLIRPRPCYICKQRYTQVDAFYHQLCPDCAAASHAKRTSAPI